MNNPFILLMIFVALINLVAGFVYALKSSKNNNYREIILYRFDAIILLLICIAILIFNICLLK